MHEISQEIDYATETVELEEINETGVPIKKVKKVLNAITDPAYKNWTDTAKNSKEITTEATYQFENGDPADCLKLDQENHENMVNTVQQPTIIVTGTTASSSMMQSFVTPSKNNRVGKRQIRVEDPNAPSFVCTEHNENITLDCRYCRIASGFKKKCSQKNVQNNEISSSGKVTVAIPQRDSHQSVRVQKINCSGEQVENICTSDSTSQTVSYNSIPAGSVAKQRFRAEWLAMPEFKDWLMEHMETRQAKCKYCGTVLVNNANNLVRHAISKKHMKNMEFQSVDFESTENQIPPVGRSSIDVKSEACKEEIFGQYVASELKRIKGKKTYEEVKWKILQAIQAAAEREAEDQDSSDTIHINRM